MWAETYNFVQEGFSWASRTDKFIQDRFSGRIYKKNEYSIDTCKDRRERQVLAFLIPCLYGAKPEQATITVGNTIFAALVGDKPVKWAQIISDVVQKLLPRVAKKLTPITPFMYHLYQAREVQAEDDEVDIKVAEDLMEFKEEHGEEEEQGGDDTDTESTEAEPEVEPLPETALAKSLAIDLLLVSEAQILTGTYFKRGLQLPPTIYRPSRVK